MKPPVRSRPPGQQLAFELPIPPRMGAEDFLVGPTNEEAFETILRWPDWPDPVLRLEGPEGSGKTHLAMIWATRAHAWIVPGSDVTAERAADLLAAGALVIEDVDRSLEDEAGLFHLLNLAREQRAGVLITARTPLDAWTVRTPDLRSRLRLAPRICLAQPDDSLLRILLVKRFIDRQIIVDASVVNFLASRIERSFAALDAAVLALDRMALGNNRRITRALAGEYIRSQETEAKLF